MYEGITFAESSTAYEARIFEKDSSAYEGITQQEESH